MLVMKQSPTRLWLKQISSATIVFVLMCSVSLAAFLAGNPRNHPQLAAASPTAISVVPTTIAPKPTNLTTPTTVVTRSRSRVVRPRSSVSAQPRPSSHSANQALGHSMMLAAGFGEDQWGCLDTLWGSMESGWSETADNPTSTAYGIPQSLGLSVKAANAMGRPELANKPGSKMVTAGEDYLTNPATQISWGLSYVRSVYKTPCLAVQAHHQKGWY